jgi:hypothetical protein
MKHERFIQLAVSALCVLAFAVQAQVSVSVAPDTVFLGEGFTASGTGFTPNGLAVLHFATPFGVERPTSSAVAGANGAYSTTVVISSGSSNLPVGRYRHWAVDQTTGIRSADVFITVTPAHVIVAPRLTINKIDNDGNGYFSEATLQAIAFASSGFHRIDVKLYRRDCQGQETLVASINGLLADYGPGIVYGIRTLANSQRELWDFRMDVFANGIADSLLHQIPYGQSSQWTSLPMWDGTPVCTSAALFPTLAGETVLNKPLAAYHGDTLCVEIRLAQNPQPINAFAFTVQVDAQQLAFVQAKPGNLTGDFIAVNGQETPAGSGVILCGGFGANAIPANSSGSLLHLCFLVQCQEGALGEITLKDLGDDVAGLGACCNAFVCTACKSDGDVDHNNSLTPGDALCAFQIYLNGGALPASCAVSGFPCELVAADVNCDASVTPGDALAIFQRYLQGLPPEPCFAKSSLTRMAASPLQLALQPRLFIAEADRAMLKVALTVDNPAGISAFGGRLVYPKDKLEFVGVLRAGLTAEWNNLDGRELAPGVVAFGGFNVEAIKNADAGDVLEFLFAKRGEPIAPEDFALSDLADDFSAATVQAGNKNAESMAAIPQAFQLHQNFPNPFRLTSRNRETLIRFDIPGAEKTAVELSIHNLAGQLVRRLVAGNRSPGLYEVKWDGKDERGLLVPSGTYWYRLRAGEHTASRAVTVVR